MRFILNRLREQSTWRGLAVLATLAGINIAPDQFEAVGNGFIAVLGILAVLWPEKSAA